MIFRKKRVHPAESKSFKSNVSLYWVEKIWLLVDYLQVYGVLWNMGQWWEWPYIWTEWTKWSVWINLDYFSTTEDGAIGGSSQSNASKFGEMSGYIQYAFMFSIIPPIVVLGVLLSRRVTRSYGKRYDIYEPCIEGWALCALQLLYMPVCLAVSRIYYCENGMMSVDPSQECLQGPHLYMSVIGLVLTFPFFIGLPIYVYKLIRNSVLFDMETDHENRLQAWEIEMVFALDNFWERSQLWLSSSFKRPGVYFRFYILAFKCFVLCIFLLLRLNFAVQAVAFWLGTAVALYFSCSVLPYRLLSSNVILLVFATLLVVNSTFAMCNACGVQNSVMVSSTESVWLLSFNSAGLFVIIAVVCLSLTGQFDRWPTSMTLKRISRSSKWPTMVKWINCIEEATAINLDSSLCPPETVDIMALEESIRQLRQCWMYASSVGSVFSVILSDNLNRLMITHSIISPNALRHKKHWDKEYLKSGRDMFDSRHKKYYFWNEKKRRIILKLFALRAFMGNKKLKKNGESMQGFPFNDYGGFGNFGGEVARSAEVIEKWESEEEYSKLMEFISQLTARTETALKDPQQGDACQSEEEKRKEMASLKKRAEELIDVYEAWDDTILNYESKELPGGSRVKSDETEDWYTYRHVAATTLETVQEKIDDGKDFLSDSDDDNNPDFSSEAPLLTKSPQDESV